MLQETSPFPLHLLKKILSSFFWRGLGWPNKKAEQICCKGGLGPSAAWERESASKVVCGGLPCQCVHWPPWKIDRACRYTLAFKTRISMNSIDFICNVVAIKDTSCMVHCHPIDWTTDAEIRRYRMVGAKIVYRTVARYLQHWRTDFYIFFTDKQARTIMTLMKDADFNTNKFWLFLF
jgi:hypothetical protein